MSTSLYQPLSSGEKHTWSDTAMRYILTNHKEMFIEDIAVHVERTVAATKNKAFRMGCSIKTKPQGDK